MEIIIEILAEVVLQVLFELGFRSLIEPFKKSSSPFLAFIGYAVLGAIAGGISLLFIKEPLIINHNLRIVNLMITPCLAGLTMSILGRLREKQNLSLIRLDKFVWGFIFAFAMTLLRFLFSK